MAFGDPSTRPQPSLLAGAAEAMARVRRRIARVAPTESTVLLLGETGTGKELLARAIHDRSGRRDRTFVKLNCAAIPSGLLESELFGHERGAFTGAVAPRLGRFELARGGTLFLDEIGELEPALQGKLLRALQDRRFERLGGTRSLALEARVVAATHRDLRAEVRAGRFRPDLWFRLCVFTIELPPLRERPGDLALLVRSELPRLARRLGVTLGRVEPGFLEALARHAWPGNVRELLHTLERALLLAEAPILDAELARAALAAGSLEDDAGGAKGPAEGDPETPGTAPAPSGVPRAGGDEACERLAAVLRETGGNLSRSARRLGVARSTLRWQVQRFGLQGLIPED